MPNSPNSRVAEHAQMAIMASWSYVAAYHIERREAERMGSDMYNGNFALNTKARK
jgi:hypothetical protein